MRPFSALSSNDLWVIGGATDLELIIKYLNMLSRNGVICLYGTPCDEIRMELEKLSFSNDVCLKEYDTNDWTYSFSFKGIRKLKNQSFHILLNEVNQKMLVDLAHKNVDIDVCTDLVLYEKDRVLLEVSGVGHNPIFINSCIEDKLVKQFTLNLNGIYMTYSDFMKE